MRNSSRIPTSDHASLPWRINEIAPDFELIDAWLLPTEGTLEEFADLCAIFSKMDPSADRGSGPSRLLFALRDWIGKRMGWDEEVNSLPIPGHTETTLRDRLPEGLAAEANETTEDFPFAPVFRTADEWAVELSNSTVHAVLHLGWVEQQGGRYRGQMGVYVKTRGRLGPLYMAAIAPFRHYIVYPAMMRRIGAAWQARGTPLQGFR